MLPESYFLQYRLPVTDNYLKLLASTENEMMLNDRSLPDLSEKAGTDTNGIVALDTVENDAYSQIKYREKRRLLWHGKTCMSLTPDSIRVTEEYLRLGTFDDCR